MNPNLNATFVNILPSYSRAHDFASPFGLFRTFFFDEVWSDDNDDTIDDDLRIDHSKIKR